MGMGCRPGGISSMIDRSRSPYRVSASERGMGVAVITSRCGLVPLERSAARCSTPKRCCSSTTTNCRSANVTGSSIRACVPITILIPPLARPARISSFSLFGSVAHQQADLFRFERSVFSSQHGLEGVEVLVCQDGGGCHDGCLCAGLVHHGCSQGCHDGFPGTDVALQQAVHRLAGFQVGADIGYSFFLGIGQGEGQGWPGVLPARSSSTSKMRPGATASRAAGAGRRFAGRRFRRKPGAGGRLAVWRPSRGNAPGAGPFPGLAGRRPGGCVSGRWSVSFGAQ